MSHCKKWITVGQNKLQSFVIGFKAHLTKAKLELFHSEVFPRTWNGFINVNLFSYSHYLKIHGRCREIVLDIKSDRMESILCN